MSKNYTSEDLMSAIVDLGDATAHGFAMLRHELRAEMNARFDQVDRCFEQVDRRFDALGYSINKRFDSVDLRFDVFERRVQILERS